MLDRRRIDIAFLRTAFQGLTKHWRSVASPRLMQRFGVLPSSTTLAIQVTLTTTVTMYRFDTMSRAPQKNCLPAVTSSVRQLRRS